MLMFVVVVLCFVYASSCGLLFVGCLVVWRYSPVSLVWGWLVNLVSCVENWFGLIDLMLC